MSMSLQKMLILAKTAAIEAGDHARRQICNAKAKLKTYDKSIVTQFDFECQNLIIDKIKRQYPQHGIIGEESESSSDQDSKPLIHPAGDPEKTYWVIDPIDGTRNYAHGLPIYTVSIAAIRKGRPVLGVIYEPSAQMLFAAVKDQPSFCNEEIIQCKNETLNLNSQIAISGNLINNLPRQAPAIMKNIVYMNLGSAALHFAYVASGVFTASIALGVKLWDIAAGAVIAGEAGAVMKNIDGSDLFPFDCDNYRAGNLQVVIGHESVLNQIIEIIRHN